MEYLDLLQMDGLSLYFIITQTSSGLCVGSISAAPTKRQTDKTIVSSGYHGTCSWVKTIHASVGCLFIRNVLRY